MSPGTVLFDLDGTLIDTRRLYLEAYRRALAPYLGRALSDREILAARPRSELRFLADQVGAAGGSGDAAIDACFTAFHAAYQELHVELFDGTYSGVPELLDGLRRAGRRLGVVTGKSRRSWDVTAAHAGLGPFDVLVFDQDVRDPKPSPEGIRLALDRLGARPDDALYVGDTRGDIGAALGAGVGAIAALWSRPPEWRGELLAAARDAGAIPVERPGDILDLLGLAADGAA